MAQTNPTNRTVVQSRRNKKTIAVKGRTEADGEKRSNANLPALKLWEQFEWAKPFELGCMFATHDIACAQKKVLNNHKNEQGFACVWMTILAITKTLKGIDYVDQMEWTEMSLGATHKALRTCAKKNGLKIHIHTLVEDGDSFKCELSTSLGDGDCDCNVLLIPVEDSHFHLVPIAKPGLAVVINKPILAGPVLSRNTIDDSCSSTAPTVASTVVAPLDSEPVIQPVLIAPVLDNLTYAGIYPPPPGVKWIHGWWASTCPHDQWESICSMTTMVKSLLPDQKPDIASATSKMVKKYMTSVFYLPAKVSLPLTIVRNQTITDQVESDEFFTVDSVIIVGKTKYRFHPVTQWGLELYRLTATSRHFKDYLSACVRTLNPFVDAAETISVEQIGVPKLSDKSVQQSKWIMEVHSSDDTLKTAVLQRLRQDAAAHQYGEGAEDVDAAARWVTTMRKQYPGMESVSGRYGWGYCYSCGSELPGTFKQRLCKKCFKGQNTQLGDLVAKGYMVANSASPVVYPGVVNTKSQHPALKPEETFATERNFRLSPSVQSLLCKPLPSNALVRVSGGLVSLGPSLL